MENFQENLVKDDPQIPSQGDREKGGGGPQPQTLEKNCHCFQFSWSFKLPH